MRWWEPSSAGLAAQAGRQALRRHAASATGGQDTATATATPPHACLLVQPVWVLDAGHGVGHALHGCRDGDDLLNRAAQPLPAGRQDGQAQMGQVQVGSSRCVCRMGRACGAGLCDAR
jgi:hypothetical protein